MGVFPDYLHHHILQHRGGDLLQGGEKSRGDMFAVVQGIEGDNRRPGQLGYAGDDLSNGMIRAVKEGEHILIDDEDDQFPLLELCPYV